MVKKMQKNATEDATGAQLSGKVKESAQQIWLAGLGAFAKAQQEGGKMFETLVKEGTSLQRKTQAVAEQRISDATGRMASLANEISSKAAGQWDKLETIFESRVAKAMKKLDVPSSEDIATLHARIDELDRKLAKATRSAATRRTTAKPGTRPASRRTGTRKPD